MFKDENENEEAEEDIAVAMETESLDDQEVSNLANNMSNMSTTLQNSGKGRKHSFFQVCTNYAPCKYLLCCFFFLTSEIRINSVLRLSTTRSFRYAYGRSITSCQSTTFASA